MVLADAAPSGAGLAIVAIVVLAFLALVVGTAIGLTMLFVRRARARRERQP